MPDLKPPSYPEVESEDIPGFHWPDGKRCGVTIGWHVDGEAGPVGWNREAAGHVAAMSEAAYGIVTALPRILDMHRRLGVPATFFVPAHIAERYPSAIEGIMRDGHELAHHGYMHENVFLLSRSEQQEMFAHGSDVLKSLTGKAPRGWSAPGWGVNAATLDVMIDLGMRYDASLMDRDRPYELTTSAGSLIELPIAMSLDDWALFGVSLFPSGSAVLASAEEARVIWLEEFLGLRHFGGLFNTTFHPNLMGRPGRLLMLERLLEQLRGHDDVWWGTCEALADYSRVQADGKEEG